MVSGIGKGGTVPVHDIHAYGIARFEGRIGRTGFDDRGNADGDLFRRRIRDDRRIRKGLLSASGYRQQQECQKEM